MDRWWTAWSVPAPTVSVREHEPVDQEPLTTHEFDCPRCHRATRSAFHGPCDDCREVLRGAVRAEARDVEVAAYEPKMNVTPNAVATKD